MYELKIITHFSAAHQLREFQGKCEHLHGHNWKIEVYVGSDMLDDVGVVMDFRILKDHVSAVLTQLDHTFLNELPSFQKTNPSSENIAKHIAEALTTRLQDAPVTVTRVTAWESDNACATYYPKSPFHIPDHTVA